MIQSCGILSSGVRFGGLGEKLAGRQGFRVAPFAIPGPAGHKGTGDKRGRGEMDRPVRYRVRDGIALIVIASVPVNALTPAVRKALAQTLASLAADPTIKAVLIGAEGPQFSGGIDLREYAAGFAAPDPADLTAQIEAMAKPVIALLQGPVLAAGADLALAAHYRLALPAATIGFPERPLGLIPVAGATQRLSRLVGVPLALDMLLAGRAIGAEPARRAGLIDGVVRGDLRSGGHAYVNAILAQGRGARPVRADRSKMADAAGAMAAIAAARARLGPRPDQAGQAMIDCVEAALLMPFDAGLAFEREALVSCVAGPEHRALRHIAWAERRLGPNTVTSSPEGRVLTEGGQAVVARLTRAIDRAVAALARANTPTEHIDAALVGWGLPQGPYGGRGMMAGPTATRICRRVIAALMAEGCRVVQDKQARSAAEIDALAVIGLGLDRRSGGPMFAAVEAGLAGLATDMRRWIADDRIWAVPVMLDQAIKAGGRFGD
jgi:3-hydroxyacyl-CoA dehydrogenase